MIMMIAILLFPWCSAMHTASSEGNTSVFDPELNTGVQGYGRCIHSTMHALHLETFKWFT